ncbi:HNH endonuclease [Priestia megaterium]|uniref:HNH endonuclease n=1 Tax=Priestia megaterium TaxID=1404 RepID=UPI003000414B
MIKVDRSCVPEPEVLRLDNCKADGEKNRAIKHFECNGPGPVTFNLYREAKPALEELFNKKCAYCESKAKAVASFHVEHWRPKRKVKENLIHKGYYWLASEWENLFLSCPTCNSTTYKGNRFPLKNGSRYANNSNDQIETIEKPLLLNPCLDNPEKHLHYKRNGFIKGLTVEGRMSIEVYGLFRSDLIGQRMACADMVFRNLHTIEECIEEWEELLGLGISPSSITMRNNRKRIKEQVKLLKASIGPKHPYSAMCKFLIKEYRQKRINDSVFIEITKSLE